ncbi:U box domain-containing protein [Tieghemostelium lacteum]|uniref:Poly [ADP-ribose] polymerase n=1 Tax=Tieghemostelium lacteum TaxID=361077 RepID=A0A151ZAZ6_TIELA|nr:U box domain-containing protein [Tieghemostelium lacteum]|eukprot:KYQ91108.1 U box domain-containing protein [Tieghemostelium lacteum]
MNEWHPSAQDIYPTKWQITREDHENDYRLVNVDKNSIEYQHVVERFSETLKFDIIKIERVQNSKLWKKYYENREKLASRYGVDNPEFLESTLFHGTRTNEPHLIYSTDIGFDIKHSRHGSFGIGLYFALNSSYSHGYAYAPAGSSLKQMFLCKVILGNSTNTSYTSKAELEEGFDSVKGGDIYVLKQNLRAYPDYLITYTDAVNNRHNSQSYHRHNPYNVQNRRNQNNNNNNNNNTEDDEEEQLKLAISLSKQESSKTGYHNFDMDLSQILEESRKQYEEEQQRLKEEFKPKIFSEVDKENDEKAYYEKLKQIVKSKKKSNENVTL